MSAIPLYFTEFPSVGLMPDDRHLAKAVGGALGGLHSVDHSQTAFQTIMVPVHLSPVKIISVQI